MRRVLTAGCVALLLVVGVSASARANLIANGDFATGNFTGWTLASTANGTLGAPPLPQVSSFNVTGSGATNAAQLQVGEVSFSGLQEGGSLSQNIVTGVGTLVFSAAIASSVQFSDSNAAGGVFSVLLDGVTLDTVDVGPLSAGQIIRDALSFSAAVGAGSHDLEILITRPFTRFDSSPFQYVTDATADLQGGVAVPEPASILLLGGALLSFAALRHRKSLFECV